LGWISAPDTTRGTYSAPRHLAGFRETGSEVTGRKGIVGKKVGEGEGKVREVMKGSAE